MCVVFRSLELVVCVGLVGWYVVGRVVYSIYCFCLRLYCLVWVGSFVYGIVLFVGFLVLI